MLKAAAATRCLQRARSPQDAARNLPSNSLANAGRGNTSTGSAVSVAKETVVPFSAFSHFATGTTPVSVNHTGTSVSTSIAFNLPEGGIARARRSTRSNENEPRSTCPSRIRGGAYGTATPVSAKQQQHRR